MGYQELLDPYGGDDEHYRSIGDKGWMQFADITVGAAAVVPGFSALDRWSTDPGKGFRTRSANQVFGTLNVADFRDPVGAMPSPSPRPQMLDPQTQMRTDPSTVAYNRARGHADSVTNRRIAMRAGRVRSVGRSLGRIGIMAGIGTLLDWGLQAGLADAQPGISSRAMEKDRQALMGDEHFLDTSAAATQRQRAIQAIHDSQMSVGRAIIGAESRYLHK